MERLSLAVLLASCFLCACGTTAQHRQMQTRQLYWEIHELDRIREIAESPQFPERHDLEIFLSNDLLNDLLSAADSLKLSLPQHPEVRIVLDRIRLRGDTGLPAVEITARAEKVGSTLALDLAIDARLQLVAESEQADQMYLFVAVYDIVPILRWKDWSFPRWRFLRELATVQANELIEQLPRVHVPVEESFSVDAPPISQVVRFPAGTGRVVGRLTRPGFSFDRMVRLEEVLYLSDGFHAYFSIREES